MLELYQFESSHYCEKVRLILDYKGLAYRKIEVTPGLGQVELYRMSGQRQVPVLKDGNQVVADSTAIAHYLEQTYPTPSLMPSDPHQRALCLLIEEWADESIGSQGRKIAFGALEDAEFRKSLLPASTPDVLRGLVAAVPGEFISVLGAGIGLGADAVQAASSTIKQDLEILSLLLRDRPYLVTEQPTLADFAVAGLTMYIKLPEGLYLDIPANLRGKGVPGVADNPAYATFFQWRQKLYADYRKSPSSASGPTAIHIN